MRATTAAAMLLALVIVCVVHAQQPPGIVDAYFLSNEAYFLTTGRVNAIAAVTADGIVLLDAMPAGWGRPVLDKLQGLTDMPVTVIINTHAHADHAGADAEYPDAMQIVMHENTAKRLARSVASGRTVKTFSDHMALTVGRRALHVYYFGRAHTDGDAIVVIPDIKTAYVGDVFAEKALPVVDSASGGSALALPETLARAAREITGVDRVVTGHAAWPGNRPATGGALLGWPGWNAFREYAEFTREFVDTVTAAWKKGRTAQQVAAELRMPEKYKDYRLDGAKAMIQTIFTELKQSPPAKR